MNLPSQAYEFKPEKKKKKVISKPPVKRKTKPERVLWLLPAALGSIGLHFYLNPQSYIERAFTLWHVLIVSTVILWGVFMVYERMKK